MLPRLGQTRMPQSEDARRVVLAATLLRIREFDLFSLAWRRWYGAPGTERDIERHFVAYMFRREVPSWVRQYCREVVAQAKAGPLDRRAFGAEAVPRREPPPMPVGDPYVAVAGLAALALYLAFIGII